MAYGTINSTIINHYNKTSYTLDGTTYSNIHVFKTNPNSETVSPAVYTTGNKKTLSNMNPNGVSASKVMAKTNGNIMSTVTTGKAFFGIFYANGQLYQEGEMCSEMSDVSYKCCPALCLKTDGSAIIRWFTTNEELSIALPYCRTIIGGAAALVYGSKNVFTNSVKASDGRDIVAFTASGAIDPACHYNEDTFNGTYTTKNYRTLLGHASGGAYYMVVTDCKMDLVAAGQLMCDLGCDYAVYLDGASYSQMRVGSAYLNQVAGVSAGKVSNVGSDSTVYGTAIIAHQI